ECVRQVQVVAVVLDVLDQVAADVAELEALRTGDVRGRRAPRVRVVPVLCPVGRAIGETGNGAVAGRLLRDPNQVAGRVTGRLVRSPTSDIRTESGLEQELVRHRRR